MTTDEKMAIIIEVMEDRSLANRASVRLRKMKELGLELPHDEMMFLWHRYRHEATRRKYVGYVPHENSGKV